MRTFSAKEWAELSGLKLETAREFTHDLVEMGLAVQAVGDRYQLTNEGLGCLRALREMPVYEDEVAA